MNQAALETKDESKFAEKVISYSPRIYINIETNFKLCEGDVQTREVIWRHLLTIYALLFPTSKAREVLKKSAASSGDAAELDLVSKLANQIIPHIDPNETNPSNAIMSLMSKGIFNNLLQTLEEGSNSGIDITKLVGIVPQFFAGAGGAPQPSSASSASGSFNLEDELKKLK
jgi:hypothetical protein